MMKTLHGVTQPVMFQAALSSVFATSEASHRNWWQGSLPGGRPGASTRPAQACPVSSPLVEGELQKVADIDQTEDEADRPRHSAPALVMEEPGRREATRSPSRFERASAICQDIADPIRVGPIGQ